MSGTPTLVRHGRLSYDQIGRVAELDGDVADHVVFMDGGSIAEYGAPAEVLLNPKSARLNGFLRRSIQLSRLELGGATGAAPG